MHPYLEINISTIIIHYTSKSDCTPTWRLIYLLYHNTSRKGRNLIKNNSFINFESRKDKLLDYYIYTFILRLIVYCVLHNTPAIDMYVWVYAPAPSLDIGMTHLESPVERGKPSGRRRLRAKTAAILCSCLRLSARNLWI